jgi:hypothetical protein
MGFVGSSRAARMACSLRFIDVKISRNNIVIAGENGGHARGE